MCKYCKDLFDTEDSDYVVSEIVKNKVIDIGGCEIDILLSLDSEHSSKDNERKAYLAGVLWNEDGMEEKLMLNTLTKVQIKFCPFCGRKFEHKK